MIKHTVFMILDPMAKATRKINMQSWDPEISIVPMMLLQTQWAQTSQKLHQVNGRCLPALTSPHLPPKAQEIHSVLWTMETMLAWIQFPLYLGQVMLRSTPLAISSHVQGSHLPIHKQGTFRRAQASSRTLPCRPTLAALYIEEGIQIGHAPLQPNRLLRRISGVGMVGIPLVEMVLFKHLGFAKCNRLTFHFIVVAGAWQLRLALPLMLPHVLLFQMRHIKF